MNDTNEAKIQMGGALGYEMDPIAVGRLVFILEVVADMNGAGALREAPHMRKRANELIKLIQQAEARVK
jgi:hypothetical protein